MAEEINEKKTFHFTSPLKVTNKPSSCLLVLESLLTEYSGE